MNVELKEVLESCSSEERSEVAVYIGILERIQNPVFQQEMARRAGDLRAGRSALGSDSVLELDRALSDRGL